MWRVNIRSSEITGLMVLAMFMVVHLAEGRLLEKHSLLKVGVGGLGGVGGGIVLGGGLGGRAGGGFEGDKGGDLGGVSGAGGGFGKGVGIGDEFRVDAGGGIDAGDGASTDLRDGNGGMILCCGGAGTGFLVGSHDLSVWVVVVKTCQSCVLSCICFGTLLILYLCYIQFVFLNYQV
jgi:hypothetical protein